MSHVYHACHQTSDSSFLPLARMKFRPFLKVLFHQVAPASPASLHPFCLPSALLQDTNIKLLCVLGICTFFQTEDSLRTDNGSEFFSEWPSMGHTAVVHGKFIELSQGIPSVTHIPWVWSQYFSYLGQVSNKDQVPCQTVSDDGGFLKKYRGLALPSKDRMGVVLDCRKGAAKFPLSSAKSPSRAAGSLISNSSCMSTPFSSSQTGLLCKILIFLSCKFSLACDSCFVTHSKNYCPGISRLFSWSIILTWISVSYLKFS